MHQTARQRNLACVFALTAAWAAAACDNPQPARHAPLAPTPAAGVSVLSVTISGVTAPLTVGTTLQLRLSASLSDGTQRDVTTEAAWQSSNVAVATVSSSGLLTVNGEGEADIAATFQAVAATARVTTTRVPYRVTGRVHETEPTESTVIGGAHVEVVGGPLDGYTTTTDASGLFGLPPVFDAGFRLKVKKAGYDDADYGIVVLPRDEHVDIGISPVPGPPPIARLNVRIDDDGSTGALLDFTPILFDASGSTGQNLRYSIEFGDGAVTTASETFHACAREGLLQSRLSVVDRFGRVSTTPAAPFVCVNLFDMFSSWVDTSSRPPFQSPRWISFTSHTGGTLAGFYRDRSGQRGITGTLHGQHGITIVSDDGTVTLVGDVLLKDTLTAKSLFYNRHLILRVRGGEADGLTLDFFFHGGY